MIRGFINVLQLLYIVVSVLFFSLLAIVLILLTGNKTIAMWGPRKVWAPLVLFVAGVKLDVEGKENIPKNENFIFVANHASQMDIPIIFTVIPRPVYFLAKQELRKIPVFGLAMSVLGVIFVDRKNREKAKKSIQKAGEIIRSGRDVITFPEGTRTKTGEIGLFKKGSFAISKDAKVDLIPITIIGSRKIIPSGSFRIKSGKVFVKIGKPISHLDFNDKSTVDYANHVQRIITSNFDRL